jgi:hypothetical protein
LTSSSARCEADDGFSLIRRSQGQDEIDDAAVTAWFNSSTRDDHLVVGLAPF